MRNLFFTNTADWPLANARSMPKVAALIVAAGRGVRAGTEVPKQYLTIAGRTVLEHTLSPFLAHDLISAVRVVIRAADSDLYARSIEPFGMHPKLLAAAHGDEELRQISVDNGLKTFNNNNPPDLIMIHDAARPFITTDMISRALSAMKSSAAVILASRMTDTVKRCTQGLLIERTLPRENLWRAETPQVFRYCDIVDAHRRAATAGLMHFTDDAGLAEWAGLPVSVVDSGGANTKITTPEDVAMAEYRLGGTGARAAVPDVRTGQGFDVHRFTSGHSVRICGVDIAFDKGVDAHSDGDVGLHALTDALLGAIADADIGYHFKNTDERWRGAESSLFLADAVQRVTARRGTITNVDVTILCEAPKISPHRESMRRRLGDILKIGLDRISIKATTTERLGFPGRGEGLAALATATVIFS